MNERPLSRDLLAPVAQLVEKAFRQICEITSYREGLAPLHLYNLAGYRCRPGDMTESGQAYDTSGRLARHIEIPAVPMNGCLDTLNDFHMWLTCDTSTNIRYFPTFIFKLVPGPGLAGILNQNGGSMTGEGMSIFQRSNCSVTATEDFDIGENVLYRHELTLTQIKPNSSLTTPFPYPPPEIKYEGHYRMLRMREEILVLVREEYFVFAARLPPPNPHQVLSRSLHQPPIVPSSIVRPH